MLPLYYEDQLIMNPLMEKADSILCWFPREMQTIEVSLG
jgi:hypothetical protein